MQTQQGDGQPRMRAYTTLMGVLFFLLAGANLLNRDWLIGALFLLGGFAFLKGREIDRWPKAARYLIVIAAVALAVAVLVRIVLRIKAGV